MDLGPRSIRHVKLWAFPGLYRHLVATDPLRRDDRKIRTRVYKRGHRLRLPRSRVDEQHRLFDFLFSAEILAAKNGVLVGSLKMECEATRTVFLFRNGGDFGQLNRNLIDLILLLLTIVVSVVVAGVLRTSSIRAMRRSGRRSRGERFFFVVRTITTNMSITVTTETSLFAFLITNWFSFSASRLVS